MIFVITLSFNFSRTLSSNNFATPLDSHLRVVSLRSLTTKRKKHAGQVFVVFNRSGVLSGKVLFVTIPFDEVKSPQFLCVKLRVTSEFILFCFFISADVISYLVARVPHIRD